MVGLVHQAVRNSSNTAPTLIRHDHHGIRFGLVRLKRALATIGTHAERKVKKCQRKLAN